MKPYELNAEHRLEAEGGFPGKRKLPPGVLDAIAERQLSGGYRAKRNPVCPACRIRRSNNGECYC